MCRESNQRVASNTFPGLGGVATRVALTLECFQRTRSLRFWQVGLRCPELITVMEGPNDDVYSRVVTGYANRSRLALQTPNIVEAARDRRFSLIGTEHEQFRRRC